MIRKRIEKAFEAWGYLIVRGRWPAVGLTLALTIFFLSWLPGLTIDNSVESFLRPDDPAVELYNYFRDQFDRDDRIIVAIAPPQVFSLEFLRKLESFHQDLERRLPYLEEVTSLLNARETRGEGDTLVVGDLVEELPRTQAELDVLRARVLANPLYENFLISEDESITLLSIKPLTYSTLDSGGELEGFDEPEETGEAAYLTGGENDELLASLREIVAEHQAPDFPIHVAGALVLTDNVNRHMESDVALYMVLGIIVVLALLLLLFRRVSGVVLPLIVVLLSLSATLGIMVMLEIPGSTSVQILPIFLLTVGICGAVHILTIVYQQLSDGLAKTDAIVFALGHSGLAVVMTSLTTAAGMMSFATAPMAPIAHLGILAPIGIMLALAYTLVLLPALLAIFPLEAPRHAPSEARRSGLNRGLAAAGRMAATHPWRVLGVTLLVVAVSGVGATRVRFSHNSMEWFPAEDETRLAFEEIERGTHGSITLEVLVDTGRENGLHEPETLRGIRAAMRLAERYERGEVRVAKATSVVDVVEETHQALNENRPEFRLIPGDRRLVAQELLLFENSGSDDLEELVDSQFRHARITLSVPWVNAMLYPELMANLESEFRGILGEGVDIQMTGLMALLSATFKQMILSMLRSYAFALIVITPMMILLLGSLRMGLLSMIPNLIPVLFTVGLMGWLDVPLDVSTILIGAVVIGLAVDDTIHFMHKFQRYFSDTGSAEIAIQETLVTTGAALLFTSLVLTAGFLITSLAYMQNMSRFGLLAASATIVAFLADLLLSPALMVLVARWKGIPTGI